LSSQGWGWDLDQASDSTRQIRSNLSGRPESVTEGENLTRALIERGANEGDKWRPWPQFLTIHCSTCSARSVR
jgi:hypothetical protein